MQCNCIADDGAVCCQPPNCTPAGCCRSVAWVLNGWFLFLPTGHTNLDYLMASITAGSSHVTMQPMGGARVTEHVMAALWRDWDLDHVRTDLCLAVPITYSDARAVVGGSLFWIGAYLSVVEAVNADNEVSCLCT